MSCVMRIFFFPSILLFLSFQVTKTPSDSFKTSHYRAAYMHAAMITYINKSWGFASISTEINLQPPSLTV